MKLLTLSAIGTLCVTAALAQSETNPPHLFDQARVPGAAEGSECWFAVFRERSFDLETLRTRIRDARRDPSLASRVSEEIERLRALTAKEHAAFARAADEAGVRVAERYWLIDAWLLEGSAAAIAKLRGHPALRDLQPDRSVSPTFIKTATNDKNHRVDSAQGNGVLGKGVGIAIVDSGQDAMHSNNRRPHSHYFVNGNPSNQSGGGIGGSRLIANYQIGTQPAEDAIDHGTAVAAVAAGEKWNATNTSDRGHAPGASIIGYGIADMANGWAHLQTMVKAFQQVTADAAKHGILVANMSYDGSAPPLWVEQMAMDQCVLTADVFITASAGNSGTNYAHYAHGALNIFAVGAAEADVHRVATFSSRGPLWNDSLRNYPHLVANGVNMILPAMDNEAGQRTGNGCSYAAPNVCGAAALYRSVRTNATALETRAAVLATTEDIHGKNQRAPYNDANAYGFGYLRTDQLVALGQNKIANRIFSGQLSSSTPTARFPFTVKKGKSYAVALSWNRLVVSQENWSDLNFAVVMNNQTIASGRHPKNSNEKVVFRAPASGSLDVIVSNSKLEAASVPFAGVICESLPAFVQALSQPIGTGCPGNNKTVPQLVVSQVPFVGTSYDLVLLQADPRTVAVLIFGFSDTQYGALTLPFDLGWVGAPGCTLYTSLDILYPKPTLTLGRAQQNFVIPSNKSLIGAKYFHQALIFNPVVNQLGMYSSGALSVLVGGDPN